MRIVALEEHFSIPSLVARIPRERIAERGWPVGGDGPAAMDHRGELSDLGDGRLEVMDAAGITTQVLSFSGPGSDLLEGDAGIGFAREANDHVAKIVADHPTRFAGFAHLPLRAPSAAADELERAVRGLGFKGALLNGTTRDLFLDDPSFEPILARAAALDVPLYLHPGIPSSPVRKAYYEGFAPPVQFLLSAPGWGWHADTAVHVLRWVQLLCGRNGTWSYHWNSRPRPPTPSHSFKILLAASPPTRDGRNGTLS